MGQTLHILRKDIRRFRYELCVVIGLTAVFAWSQAAADLPEQPQFGRAAILSGIAAFFLICGWWFLITQLIHEESLAGDRQFWITRPYQWRELLAAKLIFIALFVNLPWFAAQVAILAAGGYAPLGGIPQLLWMQFGVAAFVIVPTIALATVTRNLAQFVLTILCGLIAWYMALAFVLPGVFTQRQWTNGVVTLPVLYAGAALVAGWQFSRRWTAASICAGLGTVLLAAAVYYALPLPVQNVIQSSVLRQPEPKGVAVFIPTVPAVSYDRYPGSDSLGIQIPFTFTGIPAGEVARPEMLNVTINGADGTKWSSDWKPAVWPYVSGPPPSETTHALHFFPPREFPLGIHDATATIHGTMLLSLRRQAIVPLARGRATPLPDGGFCEVYRDENQWEILCSSPYQRPFDTSDGGGQDIDRGAGRVERHSWIYLRSLWASPFPDLSLSPVLTMLTGTSGVDEISLVREYPRAWVRCDFADQVHMPGVH
jgi:hypothetical protein